MVISLLLAACAHQQSPERVPLEKNSHFGTLPQEWIGFMDDFGVPGFAVVAIDEGQVVLLDAYGFADPFAKRGADIDTRYYLGSITKTFTALSIAQLAEQGRVDLDSPVQKYLPRFDLADKEFAKRVTVRDLVCHKHGIRGGHASHLEANTGQITDERFYAMLAASNAVGQPTYSNTHFTLLGRVVQSVTGVSWQDYQAEHVFAPLGMSRTTSRMSEIHADKNFALPLSHGPNGPIPAPYMKTDRTMHAAGGTLTSARDMARYMLALMNGGSYNGKRVLSEASTRALFETLATYPTEGSIRKLSGYGSAWGVGDYRDHRGLVTHGGGYMGYQAYVAMVPEKKTGIAILTNIDGASAGFWTVVAVEAMDHMLGYPHEPGVRESYLDQAERFMDSVKTSPPLAANAATSGLLTLPAEAYTGTFLNDLYGTISLSYRGGNLLADFGDLAMLVRSTAKDEVELYDHPVRPNVRIKVRLVVDQGSCASIEMDTGGNWIRFERQ